MKVRVPRGSSFLPVRPWLAGLLLGGALASVARGGAPPDALARLDLAISTAEASLAKGELPAAEVHYREALFEGWLLMGTLESLDQRLPEAREALHKASAFVADGGPGRRSLAVALLQLGEAAQAAEVLTVLAGKDSRDMEGRRLLAKALAAAGQPEQALARLDEASAASADDPEAAFLLGTEYLWLKKPDRAERLFARVVEAKPIPQTHILIGRAYRDAGEYDRARAELRAALRRDASARRAHYYLGMVALADAETGADRLDLAIAEFREELKLEPSDPLTNDQLGVALLEAERPAEALPVLETALRGQSRSLYLYHLGRCQLALDRTAEAAISTRRALELAEEQEAGASEIQKIHYQLGLALGKLGETQEAATHLAEARRLGAASASGGSAPDAPEVAPPELARSQRPELRRRVVAGLARAYLNLGVLQAQGSAPASASERFARAAEFFADAAGLDPDFPKVQLSLGVAYFNARQFDKATGPLERALAAAPADPGLRRMLGMSLLNTERWEKAVSLLREDPEREANPSLRFAYGLALVRSRQGAEAEKVLSPLLVQPGESAELRVLLGQACAEQGKDESALEHLNAAARLSPEDAGIREQLGRVYQKLGRTELAHREFEASRQLKAKRPEGGP